VFVVGNDGVLYHFWQDSGAWSGPQALSSDISSAPTAILAGENQIHLVRPSTSRKVYHSIWNGPVWTPWGILGGQMALPTRYKFSVDYVQVDHARSLNADTDTAQCSVTPGNWITQNANQAMGDVGGTHPKQIQTNLLHFAPVTVELCESVIFNYQVVNKGDPDQNVVDSALNKAAASLSREALNSLPSNLAQASWPSPQLRSVP
jgi:hypothetical protein